MTVAVKVVRLPHAEGLPLPAYETDGSAGMDLRAAVPEDAPLTLMPGDRVLAPTGLKIALPPWRTSARCGPRAPRGRMVTVPCPARSASSHSPAGRPFESVTS